MGIASTKKRPKKAVKKKAPTSTGRDLRPALKKRLMRHHPCTATIELPGKPSLFEQHVREWPRDVTWFWLMTNAWRGPHRVSAVQRIWTAARLMPAELVAELHKMRIWNRGRSGAVEGRSWLARVEMARIGSALNIAQDEPEAGAQIRSIVRVAKKLGMAR